jgi:hypothetical protein
VNHPQLYQESLFSLNRLKYSERFPIPLPDSAPLKKWECLDSAIGEALAEAVRKYHLPDFSNWQPPPPSPGWNSGTSKAGVVAGTSCALNYFSSGK